MMTFHGTTAVAVIMAIGLCLVQSSPTERGISRCTSPDDCNAGECCRIGMDRYTIPECRPLGQVQNHCKGGNEPVNRTLYYPNGDSIDVTNGYILLCPCNSNLYCVHNVCSQTNIYENNDVY